MMYFMCDNYTKEKPPKHVAWWLVAVGPESIATSDTISTTRFQISAGTRRFGLRFGDREVEIRCDDTVVELAEVNRPDRLVERPAIPTIGRAVPCVVHVLLAFVPTDHSVVGSHDHLTSGLVVSHFHGCPSWGNSTEPFFECLGYRAICGFCHMQGY